VLLPSLFQIFTTGVTGALQGRQGEAARLPQLMENQGGDKRNQASHKGR
jgi:hypothetical protein